MVVVSQLTYYGLPTDRIMDLERPLKHEILWRKVYEAPCTIAMHLVIRLFIKVYLHTLNLIYLDTKIPVTDDRLTKKNLLLLKGIISKTVKLSRTEKALFCLPIHLSNISSYAFFSSLSCMSLLTYTYRVSRNLSQISCNNSYLRNGQGIRDTL